MITIKLTSKRQVTFPMEVCQTLGVDAGDEIALIPTENEGKVSWSLSPLKDAERPWLGSLSKYAKNAKGEHSLAAIRRSIAKGRA